MFTFEVLVNVSILPSIEYPPGINKGFLHFYIPAKSKDKALEILNDAVKEVGFALIEVEECRLLNLDRLPKDFSFSKEEILMAQSLGRVLRSALWGYQKE